MSMVLVSLLVMLLVVVGMSVGVLFGRQPLKGSCGGVGAALGEKDYVCDLCGNDEQKCKEINEGQQTGLPADDLAYDASEKSASPAGERGKRTTTSNTKTGGQP
ncbi:(Na+)-NQR maturation NqrM [Marinimicrobium agarilyticum]|uniref:(Na+)-NQR maturation NqrM n=1 Tax=Marinimicrobium agarilyticum TaxID=306546 RepID=UPI00040B71D0|nr:(Na+)-NQR maturation NqrM [Marinimicrobium agarilyticum]